MRRAALSLFSHRLLAIARWDWHFLKLRAKNRIKNQRKAIASFIERMPEPKYLNLGSGPRGLNNPHWINVDGFPDKNVHFEVDLTRRLPFPDGTFDGVFCEHVLEHFSQCDGEALSREVLRVLKPNGVFRVIVPDAEHVLKTYLDQPRALTNYRYPGDEAATPMEAVNLFFRQRYEHQFLYDWETMRKSLTRAGFRKVERVREGEGRLSATIVLDDKKYAWESLYVEARRGEIDCDTESQIS